VGHHKAGVLHQVVEQAILGRAQADPLAVDQHLAAVKIHGQPIIDLRGRYGLGWCDVVSAQHRPQPADQLAVAKRLAHIVIGAKLQPADPIVLFIFGGQDHHWHGGELPQAAQGLVAVQPGIIISSSTASGMSSRTFSSALRPLSALITRSLRPPG
jgi:hypothetical protein